MGVKQQKEKRTERVEFRLTLAQREVLDRNCAKKRRTITSLVDEWIETLAAEEGERAP